MESIITQTELRVLINEIDAQRSTIHRLENEIDAITEERNNLREELIDFLKNHKGFHINDKILTEARRKFPKIQ